MQTSILIVEDEFIVANDISSFLKDQNYPVLGIASSVEEAQNFIAKQIPDMVLLDIHLKGKLTGIDLAKKLQLNNIPFIYLSAYSNKTILEEAKATKPYGFLVKPFREKDLLITLDIAAFHQEHNLNANSFLEQQLIEKLNNIPRTNHWENTLEAIVKALQVQIPFDYLEFTLHHETRTKALGFYRIGHQDYQKIGEKELLNITRLNAQAITKIFSERKVQTFPELLNAGEFQEMCKNHPYEKLIADCFLVQTKMAVMFPFTDSSKLHIAFYSKKKDVFNTIQINILQRLEVVFKQLAMPLMASEKQTMQVENTLHTAPKEERASFGKMIGKSSLLLNVFDAIKIVAPMNTSVLIFGESGTGKELIAKSIHDFSPRSKKTLVVINCAAIPENLIESTLFGHEKGAFTGATEMRIGKFEQAQGGTIFLDEIGEMPLDLQVKLLRVLQEKEIERVGTNKTIPIDVRVIAATNRNLEEEVEAGRFRLDLYYRLHVFPINTPSLRERTEDIPLLVNHFIETFSKQKISISNKVLQRMMDYPWPGNIRELENYVERSVLLSKNNTITEIYKPLNAGHAVELNKNVGPLKSLEHMEREYILAVLRLCKGKVYGEGGAAEILEIPTSTLNSKIKKLGIGKDEIFSK